MLKVIHSPIHSLNMYFYVYYMLIILLIVKDTDKSLQRILFKVASLQSQFIPLLCLYFSPYSTYCSPREFNYSSTCYGLSFLLECKCQERKITILFFLFPPILNIGMPHQSILGPSLPVYTLSHPLDINII